MRDEAVLGIDVGTTLAKAGIVALDGRLLGIGRAAYPVEAAEPGRAEQEIGRAHV